MTVDIGSLVCVDDGYLDTKTAAQSGCIVIPSRARHLAAGESGVRGPGGSATYLLSDVRITVDPTVDGEDTCFAGYHTSDLNLAVVHHALRKAGFGDKEVVLGVGLPIGEYFDRQGMVNTALIQAKQANLMRDIACEEGLPVAKIRQVHVMAQSICAWIHYVMDAKGQIRSDMGPVGVVDMGGRTLDGVVVLPPNRIDPVRSGTRNIGVMDVHRLVAAEIKRMCGLPHVPSQLVQIAVTHGFYLHDNQKIDVQKIVQQAKARVGQEVIDAIEQIMGGVGDLGCVLFVGGGCVAMPWVAKHFKNAVLVDSPAYANARGMYKYLRFVQYG